MPFCWELRGGRRSRADRLPRNEARHPPLNGGGHRDVSKIRVRPHRALLRHSRDRHDSHAPLSHRVFATVYVTGGRPLNPRRLGTRWYHDPVR
jgi:hypothetical protein